MIIMCYLLSLKFSCFCTAITQQIRPPTCTDPKANNIDTVLFCCFNQKVDFYQPLQHEQKEPGFQKVHYALTTTGITQSLWQQTESSGIFLSIMLIQSAFHWIQDQNIE